LHRRAHDYCGWILPWRNKWKWEILKLPFLHQKLCLECFNIKMCKQSFKQRFKKIWSLYWLWVQKVHIVWVLEWYKERYCCILRIKKVKDIGSHLFYPFLFFLLFCTFMSFFPPNFFTIHFGTSHLALLKFPRGNNMDLN
jgi:hypothetical protein